MTCVYWPTEPESHEEHYSSCPDCGADAVFNTRWEEYTAVEHCNFSPTLCQRCGHAPCDQSC